MKKLSFLLLSLLLVLFSSCMRENASWQTNYDEGLRLAKKQKKHLLLFLGADEEPLSVQLKTLLTSEAFVEATKSDYVLVFLDFSKSRFDAAMNIPVDATKEESDAAFAEQALLVQNTKLSMYLGAAQNPSLYVLTKDGYPVCKLIAESSTSTVEDALALLQSQKETVLHYDALVDAVRTAAGSDKVRAIDAVYEATPQECRYLVLPLCSQVPELDSANETGLVGKHLLAITNGKANDAFLEQDVEKAAAYFSEIAENSFLTRAEKQEAFYTAAYLLAQGHSLDYETMLSLAQRSYEAFPESSHADAIKAFILKIKQQIALVREMQETVQIDEQTSPVPQAAADAPKAVLAPSAPSASGAE